MTFSASRVECEALSDQRRAGGLLHSPLSPSARGLYLITLALARSLLCCRPRPFGLESFRESGSLSTRLHLWNSPHTNSLACRLWQSPRCPPRKAPLALVYIHRRAVSSLSWRYVLYLRLPYSFLARALEPSWFAPYVPLLWWILPLPAAPDRPAPHSRFFCSLRGELPFNACICSTSRPRQPYRTVTAMPPNRLLPHKFCYVSHVPRHS